MGRAATGTVIASTATMGGAPAVRTSAPANDRDADLPPVDRDIGGVLSAEYRALLRYSRRLTENGQEAADIVHIVCTRLLSQRTPIAGVENLSGWLRTIVFHTFVDLRRRARWEIPTESAVLDRPVAAPDPASDEPILTMDDVRALLATIPAHYRVPYELFTFQEMSYARIATVLGLSCTTVGTRINRARERLRRLIVARYGG
jgi:RNA polymerase sigma-70 factor (ECF subfamily)